jgi:predicted HTH transcriptional regulator
MSRKLYWRAVKLRGTWERTGTLDLEILRSLTPLPIQLDDLIQARTVEGIRLEFKATWDENIKVSAVKSVCAFANDLLNLNGGYVVLGIDIDVQGHPILPPRGLEGLDLDRVQREVRGQCERIDPKYQPLLVPAIYQDKSILVMHAPGGTLGLIRRPPHSRAENGLITSGRVRKRSRQRAIFCASFSNRQPASLTMTAVISKLGLRTSRRLWFAVFSRKSAAI